MKDGGRGAGSSPPRDEGTDTSRAGDATPGMPEADDEVYYCDLCGNVMLNLHCKLICERCGYKRDCSDP